MKKRTKANAEKQVAASEVIIATQSAFLLLFGLAAVGIATAVINGVAAFSAQAEKVCPSELSGVVYNLQLFGALTATIGAAVCLASAHRIWRRGKKAKGRYRFKR